jgi:hypothetical protein
LNIGSECRFGLMAAFNLRLGNGNMLAGNKAACFIGFSSSSGVTFMYMSELLGEYGSEKDTQGYREWLLIEGRPKKVHDCSSRSLQ